MNKYCITYYWNFPQFIVYDKTNYSLRIKRDSYEINIPLDLRKQVKELKQTIYKETKIPPQRQKFFLKNKELNDKHVLENEVLFNYNFHLEIPKISNNTIYLKYQNSEIKQITTDLCNTGFELIKQIQNDFANFDVDYNLIYKDKNLSKIHLLISPDIQD